MEWSRMKPCRSQQQEEGFVLIAVLAISAILAIIAASVMVYGISTLASTANKTQGVLADVQGRAGIAQVFSQVEANPDLFLSGSAPPGWTTVTSSPNTWASPWEQLTPSGQTTSCQLYVQNCYQVAVQYSPPTGTINTTGTALVQVTEISDCRGSTPPAGSTSLNGFCVFSRYQGRWEHSSYLDYLYFTNSVALDPSLYAGGASMVPSDCKTTSPTYSNSDANGCQIPAWQGNDSGGSVVSSQTDVIDGPIHTNGSYILICGAPEFQGAVEVNGTGGASSEVTAANCTNNATFTPNGAPVSAPDIPLPQSTSPLQQIANTEPPAPSGMSYDITGDTTLTFTNNDVVVCQGAYPCTGTTTTVPLPPGGVIYVAGNAYVSGVVSGAVSVASSQNVIVDNSLTYACSAVSPLPSSCNDYLGLLANQNVEIGMVSAPSGSANPYLPVTVDAAMLAINGYVGVPQWNTAYTSCSAVPPTLTINGAMVSQYRGAFGAYLNGTIPPPGCYVGQLQTGYLKNFYYDTRLAQTQPPWFLTPTASAWEQVSLESVPPGNQGLPVCPSNAGATSACLPTVAGLT